ncbi:vitamin K epoxide reductase family protein [Candidatus Woesebacteria bacterium]|nr:MAG: vitamin K epoxide reductase family protein [Candidatus Woesebacteria bacterium]
MKWKSKIWIILSLIALIGLVDAGYLTYEHYINPLGGCTLGGCQEVTTSKYSVIFGIIPLSLTGMLYYGLVLVLSVLSWLLEKERLLKIVSYFTFVGLLASIYFVYLQLIVLKSICPYCMLSACTSTLLCIVGVVFIKLESVMKSNNV